MIPLAGACRAAILAPPGMRRPTGDLDDRLAPDACLPVVLSNVFMTVAWYGHLKFKAAPLAVVIFAS